MLSLKLCLALCLAYKFPNFNMRIHLFFFVVMCHRAKANRKGKSLIKNK